MIGEKGVLVAVFSDLFATIRSSAAFSLGVAVGALAFVLLPWMTELAFGDGCALGVKWIGIWSWLAAKDTGSSADWISGVGTTVGTSFTGWAIYLEIQRRREQQIQADYATAKIMNSALVALVEALETGNQNVVNVEAMVEALRTLTGLRAERFCADATALAAKASLPLQIRLLHAARCITILREQLDQMTGGASDGRTINALVQERRGDASMVGMAWSEATEALRALFNHTKKIEWDVEAEAAK